MKVGLAGRASSCRLELEAEQAIPNWATGEMVTPPSPYAGKNTYKIDFKKQKQLCCPDEFEVGINTHKGVSRPSVDFVGEKGILLFIHIRRNLPSNMTKGHYLLLGWFKGNQ